MTLTEITVPLCLEGLPPSVNHAYHHRAIKGRVLRFPTKEAKAYKQLVSDSFALRKLQKVEGPITLYLIFHLPGKRQRDIDNMLKMVLDGLTGVLYDDDTQVFKVIAEKKHVPLGDKAMTFIGWGLL